MTCEVIIPGSPILSARTNVSPSSSSAGEAVQAESTGVVAREPIVDERAVTRSLAELAARLVGLLPPGRKPARDSLTGRLEAKAYPEVFLAAPARCSGSSQCVAAVGGGRAFVGGGGDATWIMVHVAQRGRQPGLVELDAVPLWVLGSITACGVTRWAQPPDTENRTSGGVGGRRGLSPSPDPIIQSEPYGP